MDNRDFRVRAFLYIENELKALDLYDHAIEVKEDAVDINPDAPNAEMRKVEIGDSWIVEYDLPFPPDKRGMAIGLFNQSKNTPAKKLSTSEGETGFVSLERCGHRVKQRCDPIERYDVP